MTTVAKKSTEAEKAHQATKDALGALNATFHRAGIVASELLKEIDPVEPPK